MTKTRDDLQREAQIAATVNGREPDVYAGEYMVLEERLSLLEDKATAAPGTRPLRPMSHYVGAVVALVNILSITAAFWLVLLMPEYRGVAHTAVMAAFLVLALAGGLIGSTQARRQ